jgi:hypothetical protein
MSNEIAESMATRLAIAAAPTAPAAGPETSARTGCSAASPIEATPPEESITSGSGS